MTHILVVEDDMDIAQGVAEYLEPKGYTLDFAYTGKQALTLLSENTYQLVLLDINLPFVNGYEICQSLSDQTLGQHLAKVPVIMMSSRSHEQDVLQGFQSGAWDYLKKPFSFSELSARINVSLAKSTTAPQQNQSIEYKGVSLDENAQTICYQDNVLTLHNIGFDLLKLLISQAPNIVKTSTIHQALWADDTPDSDPLRAHIYKLRKQFIGNFGQPFITTVKGIGYKFDIVDSEEE